MQVKVKRRLSRYYKGGVHQQDDRQNSGSSYEGCYTVGGKPGERSLCFPDHL